MYVVEINGRSDDMKYCYIYGTRCIISIFQYILHRLLLLMIFYFTFFFFFTFVQSKNVVELRQLHKPDFYLILFYFCSKLFSLINVFVVFSFLFFSMIILWLWIYLFWCKTNGRIYRELSISRKNAPSPFNETIGCYW